MPEVSVIIAAWNAAAFIDKAIASTLHQADVSLEVIVVDDASTDQTAAAVGAFADPRVRYLRLGKNRGPAGARNAALDVARGDWIAVLDADDMFLPGRLARLIGVAEANQLDLIADNLWVDHPLGTTRKLLIAETLDERLSMLDLAECMLGNRLFAQQHNYGYLKPLFRSAFLTKHNLRYDESLRIAEDFHLVAAALASGARYGRHASAGYIYVTHPLSISHRLNLTNASAMVAADRRFLARFGDKLTAAELRAANIHLRSVEDGAAFVAMVTCVKRWHVLGLLLQAYRRPAAIRHFSMPIRAAISRLSDALRATPRDDRSVRGRVA